MPSDELQGRVDDLIARPMSYEEAQAFSHFDEAENERASELAVELSATARDKGLEAAINRAYEAAERESVGVVKHAVKLFVTHDPDAARDLAIASPEPVDSEPIASAKPEGDAGADPGGNGPRARTASLAPTAAPERAPGGEPAEPGAAVVAAEPVVAPAPAPGRDVSRHTPPEEAVLDWYREDPFANDHHHHWHLVYPSRGTPPEGRTQPRQGELFFYMHQQMLARYDTERKIADLPAVEPLVHIEDSVASYDLPIEQGFALEGFGVRRENTAPSDPPDAPGTLDDMSRRQATASDAVRHGQIAGIDAGGTSVTVALDENVLGCFIESSDLYRDQAMIRLPGAGLHGAGHNIVGSATEDPGPNGWGGPMFYFETAIRDPVFYRWHRHVDDMYADWQNKQQPNDLSRFAADVEFRKQGADSRDLALCLARDIPGSEQPGFDFAAWGERELGLDLDGPGPMTDALVTYFTRSTIELPNVQRLPLPEDWLEGVVHLKHHEVIYFLRIVNLRQERQDVTVRLFIAHHELAHDRRMWIELDKFVASLNPGPNLVARPDARSSVVKRKGLHDQGVRGAESDPSPRPGETTAWCDCGWPYTLLVPSGAATPQGTTFKLMVCVTDHASDQLGTPETCGSMSFCGARSQYPDRRTMGYPFDRAFEGSIEEAVAAEPSAAMRDVRIRCATHRPASQ